MGEEPLPVVWRSAQAALERAESLNGSDQETQDIVKKGLLDAEKAARLVTALDVFSRNEQLDDINTGDIKYLMLPFFSAELLLKVNDRKNRIAILQNAINGHKSFLDDLERLGALKPEARDSWRAERSDAHSKDPSQNRTLKVSRVKAEKVAKERLQWLRQKLELSSKLEEEGLDADELEREHAAILLNSCAHTAIDSIRSAKQEHEMLQEMEKLRRPDGTLPLPEREEFTQDARQRFQTITIGPGGQLQTAHGRLNPSSNPENRLSYETAMRQIHTGVIPGLYTYSVEEGLRQEEAERAMAEAHKLDEMSAREVERNAKREELGSDDDDDEAIRRARAKDDWKDTHKRGAGNRYNRS